METIITIAIIALFVLYLIPSIKIAKEHERFAVNVMGRFLRIRGPGLVLRLPGSAAEWTRLAIGDDGQYLGDGIAKFGNVSVPVEHGNAREGNRVRITSFLEDKVWVSDEGPGSKVVTCENCGHKMSV
jgi:hypothetical protein